MTKAASKTYWFYVLYKIYTIRQVPYGRPIVIGPDFIDTVHVSGNVGERFIRYENQTAFRIQPFQIPAQCVCQDSVSEIRGIIN